MRFEDGRLLVNEEPSILLCASLFYFRIPRAQWAERLAAVKGLGYHAIDVYIPWNHHEVAPGDFDFTGEKDVRHFLELAADSGLLVLARPGPYICSEFDGGALPAWLGTVDGLRIRQNEPRYLDEVKRWFERIMPVLADLQVSSGGAVALLQIENELDFFECDDPAGYIAALKGMADRHDIRVPMIACAGQGDLERATGLQAGVVPAVNLYPDDRSPDIENRTSYYARHVKAAGFPLLITETNRLHRTLKRELAAGAALLGPYLQASGWNFDYTASLGNWGSPLGLMASDYDFGGVIAPDGSERADAAAGRILSLIIGALGPRLGAASVVESPDQLIESPRDDRAITVAARALHGGGLLVGLTNLTASAEVVALSVPGGHHAVRVRDGECVLVVAGLPLHTLGIDGTLVASDSELIEFRATGDVARVTVHTATRATLLLELRGRWQAASTPNGDAVATRQPDDRHLIDLAPGAVLRLQGGGRTLEVTAIGTRDAGRSIVDGDAVRGLKAVPGDGARDDHGIVDRVRAAREFSDLGTITTPAVALDGQPRAMEHLGVYRGGARYSSEIPAGDACGILLGAASDIITITADGIAPTTFVNGGTDVFVPFIESRRPTGGPLTVDAEIWGHANFHDERLPSLRLGSLRGLDAAALITAITPIDAGWTVSSPAGRNPVGTAPAPLLDWGGWSSSARPEHLDYRRVVTLPPGGNAAAVRITGTRGVHHVVVNGMDAGRITPLAPVLDISDRIGVGETVTLEISTERSFSEPVGSVEILTGTRIDAWRIAGFGVAELQADARRALASPVETALPLAVNPGRSRWLAIDVRQAFETVPGRDVIIRTRGDGVRLTFMHHGHIVGRVWTRPDQGAPFTGGRGDIALAPAPWLDDDPTVMVLVQACGPGSGTVEAFELSHRIDGGRPDGD